MPQNIGGIFGAESFSETLFTTLTKGLLFTDMSVLLHLRMVRYIRYYMARLRRGVLFLTMTFYQRLIFAAVVVVVLMCILNSSKRIVTYRSEGVPVSETNILDTAKDTFRKQHKELNSQRAESAHHDSFTTVFHVKREVRHIGFLKVHKAASSTVQNIFFRFGLKRNLTFVFTAGPNYFSRTSSRHLPLIKPKYRTGYDILCNHGIFNYTIYSSLLPDDSTYVAIVRDPLDVFISAVNYYSQRTRFIGYIVKTPIPRIQNLIRYPEKYDKGFFTYTKNIMARDFGFEPRLDQNYTGQKLKELDEIFKVVLIVEYFEESLILMKRLLNWKLQDIIFIPNNVYGKGESMKDLAPDDIKKFEQRNSLDYSVYNKFLKKFWALYDSQSEDIHLEVNHFKQVLKCVLAFCKGMSQNPLTLLIPESIWNEQFEITKEECALMMTDELIMIQKLRKIQGSEIPLRRRIYDPRKQRQNQMQQPRRYRARFVQHNPAT